MNRKIFIPLCLTLLLVPMLMAQVPPQPSPVQLPTRPMARRTNAAGTNSPFHFPTFPTARPTPTVTPPTVQKPSLPLTPIGPHAATAPGGTNTNEVADIEYHFVAVPLPQLLDIYADLIGRTLLHTPSGPQAVPDTTTITLNTQSKLTRSDAIVALETILDMNGITVIPLGDKFAKVVTEANAPTAGGLLETNTNNLPISGKFVTQIVQVKYADPKDLVDALSQFNRAPKSVILIPSTQTLILRDYAENVARMMEMVARIDVETPNTIKPKVIPIKYALASDIASALSALGASGGTSVGKQTSGAGFRQGTGTTGNGFVNGTGGAGGIGGSTSGVGGYPGQPTTTSALGSQATSARSSFQQNLQNIVKNAAGGGNGNFQLFGQTKIIADERTNSLLVFANDEDMKMIEDIIGKLDVVLPQVLIDAIVMEINLTETRNTGISYGTQNGGDKEFNGIGGVNNLSSAASGFLTGTTTDQHLQRHQRRLAPGQHAGRLQLLWPLRQ